MWNINAMHPVLLNFKSYLKKNRQTAHSVKKKTINNFFLNLKNENAIVFAKNFKYIILIQFIFLWIHILSNFDIHSKFTLSLKDSKG